MKQSMSPCECETFTKKLNMKGTGGGGGGGGGKKTPKKNI
jgi:hypothetical protein